MIPASLSILSIAPEPQDPPPVINEEFRFFYALPISILVGVAFWAIVAWFIVEVMT